MFFGAVLLAWDFEVKTSLTRLILAPSKVHPHAVICRRTVGPTSATTRRMFLINVGLLFAELRGDFDSTRLGRKFCGGVCRNINEEVLEFSFIWY